MSHGQLVRIASLASLLLACALLPATAGASIGVGTISTFAGSPVFGPVSAISIGAAGGSSGEVATVTLDGTQYAYYAGTAQNVVRRIDLTTDQEQVVAGNGGFGPPEDGKPATETTIGPADSVSIDANGDMAILGERGLVAFVPVSSGTYFGTAMEGGHIYTLPVDAETIALEPNGNLIYDYDGTIQIDPVSSGVTSVLASGFIDNLSIAADPAHPGNFAYIDSESVADKAGHEIDYYAAEAGTFFGRSMSQGMNHLADYVNEGGFGVDSGDNGPASGALVNPESLAFDAAGDLLILDDGQDGVHDGQQRLVAATSCASDCLYGLAATTAGYIYRTELPFYPVAIAGNEDALAGEGLAGLVLYSPAAVDEGAIAGDGSYGYDGDGGQGAVAQLSEVTWVASDASGDVAIVDGPDSRVRFIPTASGTYFGQAMTGGDIYTVAGNGKAGGPPTGGGGNGGSATASGATFSTFQYGAGVALDANGDLVVADPTANEVRFVPAQSGSYYGKAMTAGDVYEIGGPSELSDPTDVALDAAGNVFVADDGNGDVKKIAVATGALSTVVPSSAAPEPFGIAVDSNDDIAVSNDFDSVSFIPNSTNSFYGQSMVAGTVYKIAGNGTQGYSGDGAAATSAALDTPSGLAFDGAGDLVIAQKGRGPLYRDDAVRFLPASTGSFYGQAMTVGDIYTVAGNGTDAFFGDGGLGIDAELAQPTAVAMMPGEDVLIADSYDNRIRLLSGSVPTATTGAAGTATTESDTVEGSVNPQGRPIGYSFEYGPTPAYGASTPEFPVGNDHSAHPESQMLSGLTPATTYHYRILADYDEAGATISVPGLDATFTTVTTSKGTGGAPETPPSSSTTNTTSTGTTTTTTSIAGTTGTTGSTVPTAAPVASPILACTTAQVALVNVVRQGSHVQITGAARLVLAGKRVSIRFLATRKIVATAMIASNGTFSATAALPPAKIRETNLARYEAIVGSLHSLNLKLARRMYMTSATRSGAHVLLAGYVTGSFKAGSAVKILLRVTCSKEEVLAKVKLTRAGRFTATVPAPTGAASQIAVYRATTTVLKGGHPETTYTLPTPPS